MAAEPGLNESESARRYDELDKESQDPWADLVYSYADLMSIQPSAGESVRFSQENLIARIEHNPVLAEQHERFNRIKRDVEAVKAG